MQLYNRFLNFLLDQPTPIIVAAMVLAIQAFDLILRGII